MTTTQTLTATDIATIAEDVPATIATIKRALRERTGRTWSVTRGTGTVYCWITITAPPARRTLGSMTDEDRATLSEALGKPVHHQGESVPSSQAHRREALERAAGLPVTAIAQAYWD